MFKFLQCLQFGELICHAPRTIPCNARENYLVREKEKTKKNGEIESCRGEPRERRKERNKKKRSEADRGHA